MSLRVPLRILIQDEAIFLDYKIASRSMNNRNGARNDTKKDTV